jgi:hypothetical protein
VREGDVAIASTEQPASTGRTSSQFATSAFQEAYGGAASLT